MNRMSTTLKHLAVVAVAAGSLAAIAAPTVSAANNGPYPRIWGIASKGPEGGKLKPAANKGPYPRTWGSAAKGPEGGRFYPIASKGPEGGRFFPVASKGPEGLTISH